MRARARHARQESHHSERATVARQLAKVLEAGLGGEAKETKNWRAGKVPQLDTLARWCHTHGVSADYLLGRDVPMVFAPRTSAESLPSVLRERVRQVLVSRGREARLVDDYLPREEELLELVTSLLARRIDAEVREVRGMLLRSVHRNAPDGTTKKVLDRLARLRLTIPTTAVPWQETLDPNSLLLGLLGRDTVISYRAGEEAGSMPKQARQRLAAKRKRKASKPAP